MTPISWCIGLLLSLYHYYWHLHFKLFYITKLLAFDPSYTTEFRRMQEVVDGESIQLRVAVAI